MKHFNGQTMPSNQTATSNQTPNSDATKIANQVPELYETSISYSSPNPIFPTLSNILGEPLSREQVLTLLRKDAKTYRTFQGFPPEEQEKLLSFMEGNRGLQITYDSFFKKIMDPDSHPERLESFLSAVLNQRVRIWTVLPHEGIKLSSSGSLVIMDIVLELADGSIADVEMQKIGYAFPGERSDCYAADFIMRQYNRVKNARGDKFSFRDMRPVYLIILMEDSSKEFKTCSPCYVHRRETSYSSGTSVTNLSNIVYISLDTFHAKVHNISTELDAWLTFLSSDSPSDILKLVTAFPKFREYYQDIVNFRRHPEELIYMYSEALLAVDRNTVQYMVDELKNELQAYQNELEETKNTLQASKDELQASRDENQAFRNEIVKLKSLLKEHNIPTNE